MDERNGDEESIGALIGRAIADGRAYADAEIAYWRALAVDRLADVRGVAIFGGVALLLINAAAIALIVGLILSLAPLIGPGLATLVVVLAAAGTAALAGGLALKHLRRVTRPRNQP